MSKKIGLTIAQAEQETDAQILCVLATRASHYPTVPLIYASLAALSLPVALHYLTNWSYVAIYIAQLAIFAKTYLGLLIEPIRLFFTPKWHKKARLMQRSNDIIKTQLALNPTLKTLVVIFIAEKERLALISSNAALDLTPALEALTLHLSNDKRDEGVEAAINTFMPQLKAISPKTSAVSGDLVNIIGD